MAKSYSLFTLFLLIVICALTVSQITMMRQVSDLRAEADEIRRRYGHIVVQDPKMIHVARIPDAPEAFRIVFPSGARYMHHLSDAIYSEFQNDPTPTKTIALNDLGDGGDFVLTIRNDWENNAPHLRVYSNHEVFFDYIPKNWDAPEDPHQSCYLESDPQLEFTRHDTIRLYWWREPRDGRSLVIWMEPRESWVARRERQKANSDRTTE